MAQEFGDIYDDHAEFDRAVSEWRSGHYAEARCRAEALSEHLAENCDEKSKRWLRPRVDGFVRAMGYMLRDDPVSRYLTRQKDSLGTVV